MSVTDIPVVPDPGDEFQPLFPDQDEIAIRARWLDWANEGVDPDTEEEQWADTREGSHWSATTMPGIREFAKVYDLLSEVAQSGFVLWSWEVYLDDLAAEWDVVRNPATQAQTTVTFGGEAGTIVGVGSAVGSVPSTPDDPAPVFLVQEEGTIPDAGGGVGTIDLPVLARDAGAAGNVAAHAISTPETPLPGVTSIDNAVAAYGGVDVEGDDSLRDKTLDAVKGKGPGAVRDYVRWAGNWPGVGRVKVVPVWDGAGTVLVMTSDPDGLALPDALVDALGQDLDPVPGKGAGTAPVGAIVTTSNTTDHMFAIDAAVVFEPGYSWDGDGLTVGIGADVQLAWSKYLLSVDPGGDVVYDKLRGLLATWPGVQSITSFEVNGAMAAATPLALAPPESALLGAVTVA